MRSTYASNWARCLDQGQGVAARQQVTELPARQHVAGKAVAFQRGEGVEVLDGGFADHGFSIGVARADIIRPAEALMQTSGFYSFYPGTSSSLLEAVREN